jgi:hypothetical protein
MEAGTVTQLITAGTALASVVLTLLITTLLDRRRAHETREAQKSEYEQRDRAADASERDAEQRRITELYTKAAGQLESDKAPVRLAGLRALERLAGNTPDLRQTIVDVICTYLRMPYTPPEDHLPVEAHLRYENRLQEVQVRLAAQRILAAHLRPSSAGTFWPDIDLNLTGARLDQLRLTNCRIRNAQFREAEFSGYADFGGAEFSGDVRFDGAKFSGGYANFIGTKFARYARFDGAKFSGGALFDGAKFSGDALFDEAKFAEGAKFDGARARPGHQLWPAEWTTRDARTAEGEQEGWVYLVRVEGRGEQQPDREDRNDGETGTSRT